MILLVASNKDTASINIKQQILNNYPFNTIPETFQQNPIYTLDSNSKKITLITLNDESVKAQNLPDQFENVDLIVFISRHSSASGKPTLSVHTPGNLGDAELGGLPRTVSVSPATAMSDALKALAYYKNELKLDYEVSYECTHHGPSLNVPTMFVELGSTEKQWYDLKAAEAVAHSTMSSIIKFGKTQTSAILGIGGPHYNEKFTRIALAGEAVFGHMIPKYALSNINAEMLSQCLERTLEKVPQAILDWKGIKSEDKSKILAALQDIGLPYKKI